MRIVSFIAKLKIGTKIRNIVPGTTKGKGLR